MDEAFIALNQLHLFAAVSEHLLKNRALRIEAGVLVDINHPVTWIDLNPAVAHGLQSGHHPQQVSKDFGIKTLLEQVDLEVGPQDRLGLIGINGSGKSTLLRVMAGLEPVGDGRVQINPRHRVIYVDQNPSLDPERTVLEQVFADCGEKMHLVERYEGPVSYTHLRAHET